MASITATATEEWRALVPLGVGAHAIARGRAARGMDPRSGATRIVRVPDEGDGGSRGELSAQEHGAAPAPRWRRSSRSMWSCANARAMRRSTRARWRRRRARTQAIAIAASGTGAHGLDDDLIGKLRANRAEAFLQLERWEEAAADADVAIESDLRFVKAYVRKARASRGSSSGRPRRHCATR